MFTLKRNGRKLKGMFTSYEVARRAARSRIRKEHGSSVRGMSNPPINTFGYSVVKVG